MASTNMRMQQRVLLLMVVLVFAMVNAQFARAEEEVTEGRSLGLYGNGGVAIHPSFVVSFVLFATSAIFLLY